MLFRNTVLLLIAVAAFAQEPARPPATNPAEKIPVRINYLNVCAPAEGERKEIAAALARIPASGRFGPEFEVARGRSTMPDAPLANWVRVRREFHSEAPLSNVQYSISADEKSIVETVVFRWRDPKDVMQVAIEDSVAASSKPAAVLASDTPASRVRVERFGKSSLALARCPQADQSAYEAIFATASSILRKYRVALDVRGIVPRELALLGQGRSAPNSPAGESGTATTTNPR